MQGTVKHLGLFTDIYVGWPGRVHDARVFANSASYRKAQDSKLLPNWTESVAGSNLSLVLLGDLAYPLLPWMMKAFPDNGRLSRQQRTFNYRLSHARVVVEHTYGRLKGRWQCLLKRLDVNVSVMQNVVAACCVLHNVCEVHGDSFSEEWLEGIDNSQTDAADVGVSQTKSGESSRRAFMAYFQQHTI